MSVTVAPSVSGTSPWPALTGLALGVVGLVLVFLPECRAALQVWEESTAYGHCFLVAPIAAFLAWERRHRLRGLLPRPTALFLPLAIPGVLAWFAAERLGIMEGRQLAALGFLELLFLTTLGWRMVRVLLAPLAYLVFLVPFGAFLTPALQVFTAHFIDVGLTVLGIPHYANEMIVEISAGTFFVAEACAGLRFLIAAVAFGVFYALLNYRGTGRRLFFIGLSVVVPIIANGFRALGIVVLGHVLGSAEAAAADHIVYGWVFFSAVMLLLVVVGLPLREPPEEGEPAPAVPAPAARGGGPSWAAGAVLLLAAAGPALSATLSRAVVPASFAAPPAFAAPPGCTVEPGESGPGSARFAVTCPARRWAVTFLAAPARATGAALGDARNRLVGTTGAENETTTAFRGVPPGSGSWQLTVSREPEMIAASAVWIHGEPAPGGLRQRLIQARDSLGGNAVPPLLLAIVARPTDGMGEAALEAAQAELRAMLAAQPGLDAEAARVTGAQPPS